MSTRESGLDPCGKQPLQTSPQTGPASFPAAVAKAPSSGGAGLASPALPLCVSHGPEGRAAPGAELTLQDLGARRRGSRGAAGTGRWTRPRSGLGEGPVSRNPCGPVCGGGAVGLSPGAGVWMEGLWLSEAGWKAGALGSRRGAAVAATTGRLAGTGWAAACPVGPGEGRRNRKPGGIWGTGGCSAGRPYPTWPDARVVGWWWEGLVCPPAPQGWTQAARDSQVLWESGF